MQVKRLIYKCRRCGKLCNSCSVPDGIMALVKIVNGLPTPKEWGAQAPGLVNIHNCDDGELGVSDLIGAEKAR